jgi:Family of unknown function (DUF6221)
MRQPGVGKDMGINEFLEARIKEDIETADALFFATRIPDKMPDFFAAGGPAAEQFWARFNPARVLAEAETRRAILGLHVITAEKIHRAPFDAMTGERLRDEYAVDCEVCGWAGDNPAGACTTLALLAAVYNNHPDYQQEWKP